MDKLKAEDPMAKVPKEAASWSPAGPNNGDDIHRIQPYIWYI